MALNRLKKLKALDDEMADYYKERAQAEETYAKQLARIAKKWPTVADKEKEVLGYQCHL